MAQPPESKGKGSEAGAVENVDSVMSKHVLLSTTGRAALTRKQKRMRDIVARFQEYVRTYSDQEHYDEYRDQTFLDDMLYGIGIAMEPRKWSWGEGFDAFRAALLKQLSKAVGAKRG